MPDDAPATLRLAILGAGRMGQAIRTLADGGGWQVTAMLGRDALRDRDQVAEAVGGANVAIEFTVADVAPELVRIAARAGTPLVSGTTGWEAAQPAVHEAVHAGTGALLWSPNFAIGVHLFWRAAAEMAKLFASRPEFDAHVVETHHTAKRDAPSGTAIRLGAEVAAGLGHAVPVTSVRVGSVPGTHELLFDAPFEQLRLVHEARDRRVFAHGALVAARWLAGRRGIYTFDDVLTG